MHKNTAANEVIRRLNTYYDTNNLIDEELKTIRYAEKQRNSVSLPSQQLTGLPGGKGQHGDLVGNAVTSSAAKYYDEEIAACFKRIAALRSERDWCTAQLATLDRMEQRLIELAYLGPKDPKARRDWLQRPTWYSIAAELGISEAYARMGVRRETLYAWEKKYPNISNTLKKGKEVVDYEVENALLKTALAGNTTAQIFWLRNRRPDRWRNADRPETPPDMIEDDPLSKSIEEAATGGIFTEANTNSAVSEK